MPRMYLIPAFGTNSRTIFNTTPFGDDFLSRIKRMYDSNVLRGAHIVVPDLFTKLGGNLFLNSSAVGKYEDFIIGELIPKLKQDPCSVTPLQMIL